MLHLPSFPESSGKGDFALGHHRAPLHLGAPSLFFFLLLELRICQLFPGCVCIPRYLLTLSRGSAASRKKIYIYIDIYIYISLSIYIHHYHTKREKRREEPQICRSRLLFFLPFFELGCALFSYYCEVIGKLISVAVRREISHFFCCCFPSVGGGGELEVVHFLHPICVLKESTTSSIHR